MNPKQTSTLIATTLAVAWCGVSTAGPSPNPLSVLKDALQKAAAASQTVGPAATTRPAGESPGQPDTRQAAAGPPSRPFSLDAQDQAPASSGLGDYKALPDIVGVHAGMPLEEALAALRAHYKNAVQITQPIVYAGTDKAAVYEFGANIVYAGSNPDVVWVEVTAPPQPQRVWHVRRRVANQPQMLHANVVAALRKKYGKETIAFKQNSEFSDSRDAIARSDDEIGALWWIFDERGRPAPLPASGPQALGTCVAPFSVTDEFNPNVSFHVFTPETVDRVVVRDYCTSSLVLVRAKLGNTQQMITGFTVDIAEFPLAARAAAAAFAVARSAAQQQYQHALKKAAGNSPAL